MTPYHTDGRGSPPRNPYVDEPVSRTRFGNMNRKLIFLIIFMIPIYLSKFFAWLLSPFMHEDTDPK
jgi:hypothetical protein